MEIRIESLAAGGDGVGRAPDGRVVFVPFTAPGDRVRVRVVREHPRYLHAQVEALLAPGPGRIDPVCPVFGSCGGCAWQHLDLAVQRDAKARILADALQRIGGFPTLEPIAIAPSPAYGYRARTRVLRERGRTGYRQRRSHRLEAVSRCPVLAPALDRALHELATGPSDPEGDAGHAEEWEIAAGSDAVRCAPLGKGGAIELTVGDDRLRISPGVFFQSNAPLLQPLRDAVLRAAGCGDHALELFAGAGFFTLGLSRAFARVTAVEAHPAAADDLRHNLARAGRRNVEIRCAPLEALDALPAAEVLVLDPPRSGLPSGAAVRLAAVRAARIVYLSCDPATLARDLAALVSAAERLPERTRYRLVHVSGFDLFPQTPHVEALCVLSSAAP